MDGAHMKFIMLFCLIISIPVLADKISDTRALAEKGDAGAQWSMGNMYEEGEGVLQDYKMAHMWYNIAAAKGDEDAAENRSRITEMMSPEALNKAQDMASEWMAEHQ
jgi:TPR repeat protein